MENFNFQFTSGLTLNLSSVYPYVIDAILANVADGRFKRYQLQRLKDIFDKLSIGDNYERRYINREIMIVEGVNLVDEDTDELISAFDLILKFPCKTFKEYTLQLKHDLVYIKSFVYEYFNTSCVG